MLLGLKILLIGAVSNRQKRNESMSSKTVAMYMKKAIAALDEISEDRLKVALDFIEYLKDKEEWERPGK